MTQKQFIPYEIGDKVEIYREGSNFAVNGGYAEFVPVQGVVTKVGPDNRFFVVSTRYQDYALDARGQFDNIFGLHYSRKIGQPG